MEVKTRSEKMEILEVIYGNDPAFSDRQVLANSVGIFTVGRLV